MNDSSLLAPTSIAKKEPALESSQSPRILLLPTQLDAHEVRAIEDRLEPGILTRNARDAQLVVGKISRRERAMFELRRAGILTRPLCENEQRADNATAGFPFDSSASADPGQGRLSKWWKLDSLDSDGMGHHGIVRVVRLAWLTDTLDRRMALPIAEYLVFTGRRITEGSISALPSFSQDTRSGDCNISSPSMSPTQAVSRTASGYQKNKSSTRLHSTYHANDHRQRVPSVQRAPPALLQQTTSEHDLEVLEPIPEGLMSNYSCQRHTSSNSPNAEFIESLKQVRLLRQLQGDQIGVRAYSTLIASVAAYPRLLKGPNDVARLPGCGSKAAALHQQWQTAGRLQEADSAAHDERLQVLELFYNIWGVGDVTAREFYNKGWRDIDDIVEHGWDSLSRVQQIGVKYYEEFQSKIPRAEVESIAGEILAQARKIDPSFEMIVVGGYRRGKQESGDVDVVLSHRQESMTANTVGTLVRNLEKDELITHTLSLSTANSERGQQPLAWKGQSGGKATGFDTLDKALVVWQSLYDNQKVPSLHRRVDIIISPWKTVGCAVLGWSGGTTFQRDLRRYCKVELGLKFDSSGIRRRADGNWIDFESRDEGAGRERVAAQDMETAERRVFEGLGLEWQHPEERCTG